MKNLLFVLLVVLSTRLKAESDSVLTQKSYLSIETDPAPFLYGGYSLSLKFSPVKFEHVAITASVYRSQLPDNLIPKKNAEKGFYDLKLNTSYAIFTDYFLHNDRNGFYIGPSLFLYSKSVRINEACELNFNSIYLNMRAGYVYQPFTRCGLYLNPWFNVGHEFIPAFTTIDNITYEAAPINYIVALHIGYNINGKDAGK